MTSTMLSSLRNYVIVRDILGHLLVDENNFISGFFGLVRTAELAVGIVIATTENQSLVLARFRAGEVGSANVSYANCAVVDS